ncbi:MAG TPA: HAMP domain-containing sensor histidine kinase [Gaiellaceae bacterium]|nr:HAMP domain-containing sensor histidine kinase [Gaiellaceae bacterium]
MSFRLRLTLLAAVAVAVAIVGTSFTVYFTDRSELIGQIDSDLTAARTAAVLAVLPRNQKTPAGGFKGFSILRTKTRAVLILAAPGPGAVRVSVLLRTAAAAKASPSLPPEFSTQTVAHVRSRVLTITFPRRVVRLSRSLAEADANLRHLRLLLTFISLGGVGIAALLGAIVSRTAVAPLRRLTETTERIIDTGDLSERVGRPGRDEVSRLSSRLDELLITLEASLAAQRKLVDDQRQLVADASHELRTPIASLRANFDLLANPRALDPRERDGMLRDVRQELEAMGALVAELLELARGEEVDVAAHEFRLDETVKAVVDRVARRAPDLSFRTELEPSLVQGVPQRVERAVANLLDNARKWSPQGGAIDVAVRNGVVEVRDRGPGIASEDRLLVFNRFYRSARARGMPGAGLGLAIVKQIADAHGGDVSIEDAPGGGTILRLQLS